MKGLLKMQRKNDVLGVEQPKRTPQIPSKSELLGVLQQDNSRGGMQLEWLYDHCDRFGEQK
ncbi:MAG: hypothetical protein ACI8Z0_002618 [Lentimonas sp.]|jgi:hypothetical protein